MCYSLGTIASLARFDFNKKRPFMCLCVCVSECLCVSVCVCVSMCACRQLVAFFFCCLTVSLTALQFVFSLGALASAQEHVQGPFAAECVPLIVLGLVFVSVWKVLSPPPNSNTPCEMLTKQQPKYPPPTTHPLMLFVRRKQGGLRR